MKIISSQGRSVYDQRFLTVEPNGRVLQSSLPNVATAITFISGKAYFVYVGQAMQDVTVKFVEFFVNTLGVGPQTAEVGIFETANPPNKADQSLAKLAATGSLDSLTTSNNMTKRNSSAFDYVVPAGTYLWAGIRTAMGTTQPAIGGLCMDYSEGRVLETASASALTGTGPWTGVRAGLGSYINSAIAPDLRVTLDS